jgi:hypothetical protein
MELHPPDSSFADASLSGRENPPIPGADLQACISAPVWLCRSVATVAVFSRAGPKIRAGGRQPTEKCALQSVLDLSDRQWFMCGNGILERLRQLKSAEFEFEKLVVTSRKLSEISRKLCLFVLCHCSLPLCYNFRC